MTEASMRGEVGVNQRRGGRQERGQPERVEEEVEEEQRRGGSVIESDKDRESARGETERSRHYYELPGIYVIYRD